MLGAGAAGGLAAGAATLATGAAGWARGGAAGEAGGEGGGEGGGASGFALTAGRVLEGDTDVEVAGTSCTWGGSAFSRAARRAASFCFRERPTASPGVLPLLYELKSLSR